MSLAEDTTPAAPEQATRPPALARTREAPQPATRALNPQSGLEAGHLRVPGPDSPLWDACGWLAGLRDVPPEASWPRLMTYPHPDAVGSYGAEVDRQYRRRTGGDLRWWQRLVNARALEHDAAGRLVWTHVLESTARQVGKSTDLRELMWWRIHQTGRWGDQLVIHTGKDAGIIGEVMLPALTQADRVGLTVDRRTDRWQIENARDVPPPPREPCEACGGLEVAQNGVQGAGGACERCGGSGLEEQQPAGQLRGRWVARTWRSVYGWSPGMAVVDEAWKVPPRAVDDGVLPSLVEQPSPQLWRVSTAHPEATGLMLDSRVVALGQLVNPGDWLMLEWSAPTTYDLDDERGWRMASPHWTEQRRRIIAGALDKALKGSNDPESPDPIGSFRCQWLNQWPQDVEAEIDPDQVLASEAEWDALCDPGAAPAAGRQTVVAVEDDLGRGAAAAAAALCRDGRLVVGGWTFPTLAEAVNWAEDTAGDDGILLAGASLVGDAQRPGDPELEGVDVPVEPVGSVETQDGLTLLRALVRGGRLAHDGGADVSRAVLAARVPPNASGAGVLVRSVDGSTALVRCVAWAVRRAHRDRD